VAGPVGAALTVALVVGAVACASAVGIGIKSAP
jgi:hypothetical protein